MTCIVLKPHNVGSSEFMILHYIDFLKRSYLRNVTRISRTQTICKICDETYPVFLFGHIVTCFVWKTKTCKDLDQSLIIIMKLNFRKKYCQLDVVILTKSCPTQKQTIMSRCGLIDPLCLPSWSNSWWWDGGCSLPFCGSSAW